MFVRWRSVVLGLCVALAIGSGNSVLTSQQGPRSQSIVYGAGVFSCGSWIAGQNNSYSREADLAWVLGYLSGVGSQHYTMKEWNQDGIALWIDQYCVTHPMGRLTDAANALAQELHAK